MSRSDSRHERTAEEREQDRVERERRRARRQRERSPGDAPPAESAIEPAGLEPAIAHPPVGPVIEPPPDPVGADGLFGAPPTAYELEPFTPHGTGAPRRGIPLAGGMRTLSRRVLQLGRGDPGGDPHADDPERPRRGPLARRAATIEVAGAGSHASRAPRTRRGRAGALLALALVLAALWFLFSLFQPLKGHAGGAAIVEIPRGTSVSGIGDLLVKDGVVSSSFFFNLRATIAGDRGSLKSGRFVLKRDMSYGAALTALTGQKPQPLTTRVTVPEGASRAEESPRVKLDGLTGDYLSASVHSHVLSPRAYGAPANTRSLEGFLFPATYELLPGAKVSLLVNEQLAAFKQSFGHVDLTSARRRHLTPYDVLIVASMVEREAQLARERPLIAAVIYNRLRSHTPLGIDATIRYAIGNYTRPLTDADLRIKSPYNTRRRRGLPPTPIGSPGLASIQAAARPANVGYAYFVVKPGSCGEHVFSSNYAQFLKDAARYASARAAKGGRSPTKCS